MDKKQKSIDEILKSYYFVKWSSEEDCVSTIKAEIRELIPKKKDPINADTRNIYCQANLINSFNTAIDLMHKVLD